MQSPQISPKFHNLLRGLWSLILIAVVIVNLKSSVTTLRAILPGDAKVKGQFDYRDGKDGQLTQALLLESILSIIQNYYVDEDRVKSRDLLDLALRELSKDPNFKLKNEENSTVLKYGDQELVLQVPKLYGYNELVDDACKISRFLSEAWDLSVKDVKDISKVKPAETGLWRDKGVSWFLNAMLQGLDPHSALLDPAGYSDLKQGTEGAFGGLGVVVGVRDNLLTVIKPLPGSPAVRAGINKYDRIVKIDNMPTYGTSLDSLVEYMRGEPGTHVRLSLLRDGDAFPSVLSLTREIIQVSSIESRLLKYQGHSYLHSTIESFSSKTSQELQEAIDKASQRLGSEQLAGLILDLRSNPGGLLDQAVMVSDLFLKSGRIVSTVGRHTEVESARPKQQEYDFPITVLINADTASASEIVAGALQDNNRAIIIGQPSFGKGSVQTIFELPGEQALKLTIARYFTPSGKSIQNVGIVPDIWLQPIYKDQKNVNLLGVNRYRNEHFLEHRLTAPNATMDLETIKPSFVKSFFLTQKNEDEFSKKENVSDDFELSFSLKVLGALHGRNGAKIPDGSGRASHWLAVAGPEILDDVQRFSQQSESWLKESLAVDWRSSLENSKDFSHLRILPGKMAKKEYREGELIKIPWRVFNEGKVPVDRVSVYLRSDSGLVDTREILVGRIKPGDERSGTFEIPAIMNGEDTQINFNLGFGIDAEPVVSTEKSMLVRVISSAERPMLLASVNLVEEKDGKDDGILDPRESGKVEVTIVNTGLAAAHGIKIKMVNLAGKQVEIGGDEEFVSQIPTNGSVKVYFPIKAGKTIATEEIELGLNLHLEDTILPVYQYSSISAHPNLKMDKYSKILSH